MLTPLNLQIAFFGLLWLLVALGFAIYYVDRTPRAVRNTSPATSMTPADEESSSPHRLLIETVRSDGTQSTEQMVLHSQHLVIGRSSSTDIPIDDQFASLRHAAIDHRGSDWLLKDLGSTNGTFLNDEPVIRPVTIKSGDIVRIGKTQIHVE